MAANLPQRFAGPRGELYGVFQAPLGTRQRRAAVLLCPPHGAELVRSHRIFRFLGDRLARMGFATLRFDWSGTGESDGDCVGARLSHWRQDILSADSHLRQISGRDECIWLGLQVGATMAIASAAGAQVPPRQLWLWDVAWDGQSYIDRQLAMNERFMRYDFDPDWQTPAADGGALHLLGIDMGPGMQQDLRSVSPTDLAAALARLPPGTVKILDGGTLSRPALPALPPHVSFLATPQGSERWDSDEAMNSAQVPLTLLSPLLALAEDAE